MPRYVATAWLLLLVMQGCALDGSMKLQKVEYLVGELPEYPQQLTITHSGLRYESHSNLSDPAGRGIGVFERSLAKGDMEAIEARLDPARFRALPDHQGTVLSGDRWKRIRLTAEDGTIEKLVGTKLPVDPTLQQTIDWFDQMVEDTIRYPRSVLQLRIADITLSRNGEFSATVTLHGAGDQPVVFRPPRGPVESSDGSLILYWWPHFPGVPKSDVRSAPIASVSQVPAARGVLAAFRIRHLLEGIPPGPVAVQVRYVNMVPKLNSVDVLTGQLFSIATVVQ